MQQLQSVYLDCAATTPLDPRVRDVVLRYLETDFGNAGSRTHSFGDAARSAVDQARVQIAAVVAARRSEVIFTSGATESNNLALLGLEAFGRQQNKLHIVSTAIEHAAVLEPLAQLAARGFEVTLVAPNQHGVVESRAVIAAIRPDTLLVSMMQANNETGVLQPIGEVASWLQSQPHSAYFHVDAAQTFGKCIDALRNTRIDLISISGHKLYAPKGVGALIARRRNGERPPLSPQSFGGGQELGLRPGTLPVPLIAGLGQAAALALVEADERNRQCAEFKSHLLAALDPLKPQINGDPENSLPQIINLSFRGLDAESVLDATRHLVAISNGAACTTTTKFCSHVLTAMELDDARIDGALRFSWHHATPEQDWREFVAAVQLLHREVAANFVPARVSPIAAGAAHKSLRGR